MTLLQWSEVLFVSLFIRGGGRGVWSEPRNSCTPGHTRVNGLHCRVFCLAAELPLRHTGLFLCQRYPLPAARG